MSDESVRTIRGIFPTREAADLAVEHLSQEHGIDRTDIFVQAAGAANTSGTAPSGGDASAVNEASRDDGALKGEVEVTVDATEAQLAAARGVFEEYGARDVSDR